MTGDKHEYIKTYIEGVYFLVESDDKEIPLVRCENCRYTHQEIKDASTQETCLWCDAFDCETPLNMFCGYGKFKKGDNQND